MIDTYQIQSKIGEGTFGDVYKATDSTTGQDVVLKVLKGKSTKSATSEFAILEDTPVPGVLQPRKYSSDGTLLCDQGPNRPAVAYGVFDFAPNGDLFALLVKHQKFPEKVVRHFILQALTSLKELADRGIYHRDVKPENFLLDENFNLLLTDFGYSTRQRMNKKRVGSPLYISPECL